MATEGKKLDIKYVCTAPTLMRFHASPEYVRVAMGPLGSGKTVAAVEEIFMMAMEMPPCKDNVRRSTAAFIRDSAPNLSSTTMKTWLERFPEDVSKNYGGITRVNWSNPMEMEVTLPLPDGTLMNLLIYCRHQACDADAENLKSLNLSFAFVNEANVIPKASIDMLIGRVGRFPSKDDLMIDPATGEPYKPRFGIVMDTNMPPDDHYLYKFAEERTPKGWAFFKQPPAMFADMGPNGRMRYRPNKGQKVALGVMPAENINNLNEGWDYYAKQIAGKTHDWIRVFIMAEYGSIMTGLPVYPAYSDLIHYRNEVIPFDKTKTLFLGFDWGLHPSVVFVQMSDKGQLQVIDEIDGGQVKMGLEAMWKATIRPKLVNDYGWGKGTQIFAIGDPAVGKSQVDENTCTKYLASQGLTVRPCHTNAQGERMGAVDHFLRQLVSEGQPAIILSNKCQRLRKGFCGGYFFERKEQCRDEVYKGTPKDNSFTHIQDCLQYVCHAIKNPEQYNIQWRNHNADMFGGMATTSTRPTCPPLNMAGMA